MKFRVEIYQGGFSRGAIFLGDDFSRAVILRESHEWDFFLRGVSQNHFYHGEAASFSFGLLNEDSYI